MYFSHDVLELYSIGVYHLFLALVHPVESRDLSLVLPTQHLPLVLHYLVHRVLFVTVL